MKRREEERRGEKQRGERRGEKRGEGERRGEEEDNFFFSNGEKSSEPKARKQILNLTSKAQSINRMDSVKMVNSCLERKRRSLLCEQDTKWQSRREYLGGTLMRG